MSKTYRLNGFPTKPCTHHGVKHIPAANGAPARKQFIDVAFVPGKVTETELDMSAVVESGYIVEVKRPGFEAKEAEKKIVAPEVAQGDNEKRDEPIKVDTGTTETIIDPGKDGELGTEDDEVSTKPKNKKGKRGKLSSMKG